MDRRSFLRAVGGVAGLAVLGPDVVRRALAAPAAPGPSPYGALAATPDANGLLLPPGFTSRIVARADQKPVASAAYTWHRDPDGAAVFATVDGGWVYASNHENRIDNTKGGAGVLRFDRNGTVVDAYRILDGTSTNCAGGPTPWGTWLSCEEHPLGQVWETYPLEKGKPAVARPAMGRFWHEAVTVDPVRTCLYLTEDAWNGEDGRFYRFTPTTYPDLSAGKLEAAKAANADGTGAVTWITLDTSKPITYADARGATLYHGAEGVWYHEGLVYFTTKGGRQGPDPSQPATRSKDKVWRFDPVASKIDVLYDGTSANSPLAGVDNCVVSKAGELFVAEDNEEQDKGLVLVTAGGVVAPFLSITGQQYTELSGPAFDPSGTRLYFSSMRPTGTANDDLGGVGGIVYEVRGPFRLPGSAGTGGGNAAERSGGADTAAAVVGTQESAASAAGGRGVLPDTGGQSSGLVALGMLAAAGAAAGLVRAAAEKEVDA